MVQLNEIRCGNLFKGYDNKEFFFGVNNFRDVFEFAEIDEIIKSPVVLTSDWLTKLGFSCQSKISEAYKKYLNDYNPDACYVELKQVGEPIWNVSFYSKWSVNPLKKQVRFVHELQNLWFVYATTELEVVANGS